MNGVEVALEALLERDLLVAGRQAPEQSDELDDVLVLENGSFGNGIRVDVVMQEQDDAKFQRRRRLLFIDSGGHRCQLKDLLDGRSVDVRSGDLELEQAENDQEALEDAEGDGVDRLARRRITLIGVFLLREQFEQAREAARVQEEDVQSVDFVVLARDEHGRREFDQCRFQVVEHLRRRRVEVEVAQLVGFILLAGVGLREAARERLSGVRIDGKQVEDVTGCVAQASVVLLASQVGHFDQELVVFVLLGEYLDERTCANERLGGIVTTEGSALSALVSTASRTRVWCDTDVDTLLFISGSDELLSPLEPVCVVCCTQRTDTVWKRMRTGVLCRRTVVSYDSVAAVGLREGFIVIGRIE